MTIRIACLLDPSLNSALAVWVDALGFELTHDLGKADRLVLDYAHLTQMTETTAIAPRHWLLLDSQLNVAQTITVLQQGCGYIATAPLERKVLENWLAGAQPLVDIRAIESQELPTPPEDFLIGPFVDLICDHLWTQEEQEQAKQVLIWRNIALQLPAFKQLQESTKLSPLQQAQLACHTLAGAQILSTTDKRAAQVALQHHEHHDGSGYPLQLQGNSIDPIARLAKLYDSYIGLRRQKTYAKAQTHEVSIEKLLWGDGYLWPGQFDPQLLTSLEANADELAYLFNQHRHHAN